MNAQDVIEAYVQDVVRHLPPRERNETGFELRGLLTEMLQEQARQQGESPSASMALQMVRTFGDPGEVALRYQPPIPPILPGHETRPFLVLSLTGMALQWALTLPGALASNALSAWWMGPGLGAFWWPGFVIMLSLLQRFLQDRGLFRSVWSPRRTDTGIISRPLWFLGLLGYGLGVALMVSLPSLVPLLPGVLPEVLAFNPEFLRQYGLLTVLLWIAGFAVHATVFQQGHWTSLTRRCEFATSLAFLLLLTFWVVRGDLFLKPATDEGARGALLLVVVLILLDLMLRLIRPPVLRVPKALK